MSARLSTPSSLSAASILGPTPGSSLTGLARSAVSGVLRAAPASSAASLEVGHAIRPQADVRADHAPYLGDGPPLHTELLGELSDRLGRRDVPEVQRAPGLGRGPHLLEDRVHLALAPARSLVRYRLAVDQFQDGPHVQGGADEALGAADPAALRQVLEDRKSTRLNSSHANISYAV